MIIKDMEPVEAIKQVEALEDVAVTRTVAAQLGISYSGNTGIDTLKSKIIESLSVKLGDISDETNEAKSPSMEDILSGSDPEPIQVAPVIVKPEPETIEQLLAMDPNKIEDVNLRRKVVRAKALRLVRVQIVNLDPSDAMLNGCIVTVVNKYTGKVSKYIPFGEESQNGYHVPQIILDQLREKKYPLRKEINQGKNFGVKRYTTSMVPKFSITIMPPLTQEELQELKMRQNSAA